ncbi:F0F1 ATP synthase subunit I [Spartinivicinus marinus]|nr:F0F1 ATP synthase subunit I [Spartinivicinus marinus]MCX4026789.1 F0F1 ATP synthase subunit I [Spartinivicinus marinus]
MGLTKAVMGAPHLHKPPIYRVIIAQLIVTVCVACVLLLHSVVTAYSAFLGGLICLIPNAYLAKKAFQHSGARAAKQIAHSFYKGEAVKLGLTALLFALVFGFVEPLNVFALFGTFILVQTVNWFTALLLKL